MEEQGLELKDGTTKMFLSTKGTAEDVSKPLKNFLDYIDGHTPADEFVREIDNEVSTARRCDDWRREYMTFALKIEREKKAARAEGRAEGMLKTLNSLVKENILTLAQAAKQADMTVDDFLKAVATL